MKQITATSVRANWWDGEPTKWTAERIRSLDDQTLAAISESTNPRGKFWLELQIARDEIDRRAIRANREIA